MKYPQWIVLSLMFSAVLIGCGGGGGGNGTPAAAPGGGAGGGNSGTPPPAFGLTVRVEVAPHNLTMLGGSLGDYELQDAFPNLRVPQTSVFLAGVPGEDRMVVVDQIGIVRVFVNDSVVATSDSVLDLSARIQYGGEEGLLGLAFDPDFVQNRFLYLHYSMANPQRSVIARFTWNAASDQIEVASEKIILELDQPFSNHNGGMLAFGPDDYLYIAFGDGGAGGDPANNAQDLSTLLGSILRIDVHPANPADAYDIPADNPFVGQAGRRAEIYAYGLRNPFRFSFDRLTGDLWAGDVGQAEIEEVDLIQAGGNYGWRVFEGTRLFDDSANSLPPSAFIPPVVEYDHSQGAAVIGGYVYRGNRVPSLQGRYLYTDWFGPLWALQYENGAVVSNVNIEPSVFGVGTPSFGEDNDGEVYLLAGRVIRHLVETSPGSGGVQPPGLLSETGLFASLDNLTLIDGFIAYEVNQPFWSDGVHKQRWIAIPDNTQVTFSETDAWLFPVGTLIVKHFEIDLVEGDRASARRLETRVLVHTTGGWQGFTYRWNTDGLDAVLLNTRQLETIDVELAGGGSRSQLYEYPSPTDCLGCHTQAAGFILGPRTRQLNGDHVYPAATDNQLRSWNNIGLFTADIGAPEQYQAYASIDDSGASLDSRARAYLDINCAQCHQPGGPAPVAIDLRFDTPLADTQALDVLPSAGDLGIANARIIAVGDHARSVLWLRMQLLDNDRMPPLGSHLVDQVGIDLIAQWIDTL